MNNKELLSAIEEMLDRKLGDLVQGQAGLEQRFDRLEQRFDRLEDRVDGLEREVKRHGDILERHEVLLQKQGEMLEHQGKRLDGLENRMERAESYLDALRVGQHEIRIDIRQLWEKLDETHDVAVDCWGEMVESKKRIDILEKQKWNTTGNLSLAK